MPSSAHGCTRQRHQSIATGGIAETATTPGSTEGEADAAHRPRQIRSGYGVRSVWTSEIPASRFGPWQIRHCSFCGLVSAVLRGSQIEAPLVCM